MNIRFREHPSVDEGRRAAHQGRAERDHRSARIAGPARAGPCRAHVGLHFQVAVRHHIVRTDVHEVVPLLVKVPDVRIAVDAAHQASVDRGMGREQQRQAERTHGASLRRPGRVVSKGGRKLIIRSSEI